MNSRLPVDFGTYRPSRVPPVGLDAIAYLSSLMNLATRLVRERIADLPESRGEWDMIRALLNQMVDGPDGAEARDLLASQGVHCVVKPSERDRFWFTIPGCSMPVHVVARPKNAPRPPDGIVVQEELALDQLAEAAEGNGYRLFLFCEKDRDGGLGLKSVSLALVDNAQVRWIADGVQVVDEVLIFESSGAADRQVRHLSEEDEGIFRHAMTRRDERVLDVDLDSPGAEELEQATKPDEASGSGA